MAKKMKTWIALTCPVCGWRHSLNKFSTIMKPILYPAQIVTGCGRGKGFRVAEYLPWSALPRLMQTQVKSNLLCLYDRLGAAYDHFYEVLGLLSPNMQIIIQTLQRSYTNSYKTKTSLDYTQAYNSPTSKEIVESYPNDDYAEFYMYLLTHPIQGVAKNG